MIENGSQPVSILPLTEFKLNKSATKDFDCGDQFLNDFLQKQCAKKVKADLIRGNVAVLVDRVVGYITLQVHCLEKGYFEKEKGLPRQVPVLMIDQVAIDKNFQGRGIAKDLLSRAFHSAIIVGREAGLKGVTLWSHPRALGFYKLIGMEPINSKSINDIELTLMYINIATIEAAVSDTELKGA